jgi:uncharacterized protein (TIGR04141 family)
MSDASINKITVYKVSVVDFDSLEVAEYEEIKAENFSNSDIEYKYKLFFLKQQIPVAVEWYKFFKGLDLQIADNKIPKKISSGFIWFVSISDSFYAITGGTGHFALKNNESISIEPRFGVDIAQKILSIPELSGLVQKDTSGVVNYLHRMFRGRYNPSGDINNLKRVLTHVKGKLSKENKFYAEIGKSIQASDSLVVNGKKNFDSTVQFLKRIEELSRVETKCIEIPQLQCITKKHDSALLASLNLALAEKIKTDTFEDKSLFLDNEEIGYLPDRVTKYELLHSREKIECDTFEDVFLRVQNILKECEDLSTTLFSLRVRLYFDDENTIVENLYNLICGDIEYKNDVYFINNKQWYKANAEFIEKLNQEIDNVEYIEPGELTLAPWNTKEYIDDQGKSSEFKYNQANKSFICLDHKTVKVEEERGGIEFCDLLKHENDSLLSLVHVKRECGAALRALFAQGFVSAKLFDENTEFKNNIFTANLKNEAPLLTDGEKNELLKIQKLKKRNIRVIFAIFDNAETHTIPLSAITTSEKINGTFTLFAKVDFIERVNSIRTMGYANVAVTRIKESVKAED